MAGDRQRRLEIIVELITKTSRGTGRPIAEAANEFDRVGGAAQKAQGKMAGYDRTLQSMRGTTSGMQRAMGRLRNQLLLFAFATGGATAAIHTFVSAAKEKEAALTALSAVSLGMGRSQSEAEKAAKELASDGFLTVKEAAQGLSNLLAKKLNIPQAVEVMNTLKESAIFNRQAALSMGEAILGATEGIKNDNSVKSDNAGITTNLSVMYKRYANSIGVAVTALTDEQKAQAVVNGFKREGSIFTGNLERAQLTYAGALALSEGQSRRFAEAMGEALLPVAQELLIEFTKLTKSMTDFAIKNKGLLTGAVTALVTDFAKLKNEIASVFIPFQIDSAHAAVQITNITSALASVVVQLTAIQLMGGFIGAFLPGGTMLSNAIMLLIKLGQALTAIYIIQKQIKDSNAREAIIASANELAKFQEQLIFDPEKAKAGFKDLFTSVEEDIRAAKNDAGEYVKQVNQVIGLISDKKYMEARKAFKENFGIEPTPLGQPDDQFGLRFMEDQLGKIEPLAGGLTTEFVKQYNLFKRAQAEGTYYLFDMKALRETGALAEKYLTAAAEANELAKRDRIEELNARKQITEMDDNQKLLTEAQVRAKKEQLLNLQQQLREMQEINKYEAQRAALDTKTEDARNKINELYASHIIDINEVIRLTDLLNSGYDAQIIKIKAAENAEKERAEKAKKDVFDALADAGSDFRKVRTAANAIGGTFGSILGQALQQATAEKMDKIFSNKKMREDFEANLPANIDPKLLEEARKQSQEIVNLEGQYQLELAQKTEASKLEFLQNAVLQKNKIMYESTMYDFQLMQEEMLYGDKVARERIAAAMSIQGAFDGIHKGMAKISEKFFKGQMVQWRDLGALGKSMAFGILQSYLEAKTKQFEIDAGEAAAKAIMALAGGQFAQAAKFGLAAAKFSALAGLTTGAAAAAASAQQNALDSVGGQGDESPQSQVKDNRGKVVGRVVQAQQLSVTIAPTLAVTGETILISDDGIDRLEAVFVDQIRQAIEDGEISLDVGSHFRTEG